MRPLLIIIASILSVLATTRFKPVFRRNQDGLRRMKNNDELYGRVILESRDKEEEYINRGIAV